MNERMDSWLRETREVPFADIETALEASGAHKPGRALTSTIIAIGTEARLENAAEALGELNSSTAIRAILISPGSRGTPAVRIAQNAVILAGIKPEYIDNAVAALRLSSLPTLVWWRGDPIDMLDGLARLADRLVMDAERPEMAWRRALALLDRTAFSDLRWTRLTRWRTLMGHFFDIAAVRAAASRVTRVAVKGSDPACGALFGAWLTQSLKLGRAVETNLQNGGGGHQLEEVVVTGEGLELSLRLAGNGGCVRTSAIVAGQPEIQRMVSLGDQSLAALLTEELRVRARDVAFEQALRLCAAKA